MASLPKSSSGVSDSHSEPWRGRFRSSSCDSGVFSSPTSASTQWTNSAEGGCTLTLRVSAKEIGEAANVSIATYSASSSSGAASISATFVPNPNIRYVYVGSWYAFRSASDATYSGAVQPLQRLNVSAYFEGKAPTGATLMVSDDCGGPAQVLEVGGESYGSITWQAPASNGLCLVIATLSHDGLSDSFAVAVRVSGCAYDVNEPNQRPKEAPAFSVPSDSALEIVQQVSNDDDWFALYLSTWEGQLQVSVTGPAALPIELYSGDGVTLLASGQGTVSLPSSPLMVYLRVPKAGGRDDACAPVYGLEISIH